MNQSRRLTFALLVPLIAVACSPSMERRGKSEPKTDTILVSQTDTSTTGTDGEQIHAPKTSEGTQTDSPDVANRPKPGHPGDDTKPVPEAVLIVNRPVSGSAGVPAKAPTEPTSDVSVVGSNPNSSVVTAQTPSVAAVLWEATKDAAAATKDVAVGMKDIMSTKAFWRSLPATWMEGLSGLKDSSIEETSVWIESIAKYFKDEVRGKKFTSDIMVSVQQVDQPVADETEFSTMNGFTLGRCTLVKLNDQSYIVALLRRRQASGKIYNPRSDSYVKDIEQTLVLQFDSRMSASARPSSAAVISFESRHLNGAKVSVADPFQKSSNSNQKLNYVDGDLDQSRLMLETSFQAQALSVDGKLQIQVSGNLRCKFSEADVILLD